MQHAFSLLSGLVFGIGLILAGMTDPLKVKAFLDIAGAWDPSLALVMGGAIAVGVIAFVRARSRSRSWTGTPMEVPTHRSIDTRLILGGLLFGAGWGIAGFCPGPALVALGSGMGEAGLFVAAMPASMAAHDRWLKK
jgi:uncharacterized membrane protein YedE/YeeE